MGQFRDLIPGIQRGDPKSMSRMAELMDSHVDGISTFTGYSSQFKDNPSAANAQAEVPPPCGLEVLGVDGKFEIAVTNLQNLQAQSVAQYRARFGAGNRANWRNRTLYHQVRSARDTNFDANSAMTTYDLGTQLTHEVQDPNVTKYWQLRSSFDGTNFNAWAFFIDPATCGPAQVASGQLRSTSAEPGIQLNSVSLATVDSIDAGSSATVRVYGPGGPGTAWFRQVDQTIEGPFPSASITGQAYNTGLYVIWDGTQDRVIPTSSRPDALVGTYRFAGSLTTVGPGTASGATGIANLNGSSVASVTVTSGGTNYWSAPDVSFTPPTSGTTADGYALIDGAGHVLGVVVTNGGSGYASAPTVTIAGAGSGTTGGGGTGGGVGGAPYEPPAEPRSCFTGDTPIVVLRRLFGLIPYEKTVPFNTLTVFDSVKTLHGWRKVKHVLVHDFKGEMIELERGAVTLGHHLWTGREWKRADAVLSATRAHFTGHVFNLEVETELEEERNYQLGCGLYAHNFRKA